MESDESEREGQEAAPLPLRVYMGGGMGHALRLHHSLYMGPVYMRGGMGHAPEEGRRLHHSLFVFLVCCLLGLPPLPVCCFLVGADSSGLCGGLDLGL